MAELIRKLEKELALARAEWDMADEVEIANYREGLVNGLDQALDLAREAKCRMAEREPTWDVH